VLPPTSEGWRRHCPLLSVICVHFIPNLPCSIVRHCVYNNNSLQTNSLHQISNTLNLKAKRKQPPNAKYKIVPSSPQVASKIPHSGG